MPVGLEGSDGTTPTAAREITMAWERSGVAPHTAHIAATLSQNEMLRRNDENSIYLKNQLSPNNTQRITLVPTGINCFHNYTAINSKKKNVNIILPNTNNAVRTSNHA
jgi:hypothetical protein